MIIYIRIATKKYDTKRKDGMYDRATLTGVALFFMLLDGIVEIFSISNDSERLMWYKITFQMKNM